MLVAVHNGKNDLWSNDQLYSNIFQENLTVEHIIFTYSLARAIDSYKLELQQKGDARTDIEEKQHKYLSKRGSKMLLLYTISKCMESIMGIKITDSWVLSFNDNSDFAAIVRLWMTIVTTILPLACAHLEPVLTDGLKSKESSENAANTVVGLFASIKDTIQTKLQVFANTVKHS